ncbi:SDR family NAD(P)-dependent oxidoreductase [Microbacterium sp.]|uniref:SDR family NAD(P)-dependent oxidoreductase n=1 Tax=Microbacterium sp. TaxID=51671 RepID=UPI0037C57D67
MQIRTVEESSVVIAGGTAGVGLATALAFTRAGAPRIALIGRSRERGERALDQLRAAGPVRAEFHAADATKVDEVASAVARTRDSFGSIDVAVSSVAGQAEVELLVRSDPHAMAQTLLSLALPPMHLTRAVLPIMREQGGGSIINVASDAAKVPTPGESLVGAAMAAITMFSKTAAVEAKRDGVRINVLTPSLIDGTETTARILADGFSRKIFEKAASLAHLGVVEPSDMAELIVFLGSPAAARMTGQAISLNGGISVS